MLLHKLLDVTLGAAGGGWEAEIPLIALEVVDVGNRRYEYL